jgi:hypothetical protein
MPELKECKECGWTKVVDDFTYHKDRGTHHTICKRCETGQDDDNFNAVDYIDSIIRTKREQGE